MIINTGQRTDIPAFYSEWFCNRLKAGFVLVRNPYNPESVTKYRLNPEVVDCIGFCTKNPAQMLPHMGLLEPFGQMWHVTVTGYEKEIEPFVPDKEKVLKSFLQLSKTVGANAICWRYDPIFLSDTYTMAWHLETFRHMAQTLEGATNSVVISFIDLYEKTKRNFPEARTVPREARLELGQQMVAIAREHGMVLRPCGEGQELAAVGADCRGCMTIPIYEHAIGKKLKVPKTTPARKECACYLSGDIGAYNSCGHLCRYCYANADAQAVARNRSLHDPRSPFLIGQSLPEDHIHEAKQVSWVQDQLVWELP